jgi:hypothetical protein
LALLWFRWGFWGILVMWDTRVVEKVDDAVGNFSLANLDLFSITRSGFFLVFMVLKMKGIDF